jgi:hypothetical protein
MMFDSNNYSFTIKIGRDMCNLPFQPIATKLTAYNGTIYRLSLIAIDAIDAYEDIIDIIYVRFVVKMKCLPAKTK